MNLKLILLAVLPAIGASTSFYRPTQTAQVFPKNELLNNKVTPTSLLVNPTADNGTGDALSLRGGEGSTNADIPQVDQLVGATFFTVLQVLLNKVFVARGIKFPAMLGCTISVFVVLVLAEMLVPGLGERGFELLTPGSNVLTKWLPGKICNIIITCLPKFLKHI